MDVRLGLVAVLGLGLVVACGAPGEGAAVRGVDPASEVHVAKGQPEAQLGQVLKAWHRTRSLSLQSLSM